MAITLVIIASVLAYLACWLAAARWQYRIIRPYTEPLSCSRYHNGAHNHECYRRPGWHTDSPGEAAIWAALTGLLGPLMLIAMTLGKLIRDDRLLPEEIAAGTARMEKELRDS
jgi:hypothetical protein